MAENPSDFDVLIIGGGPGGLSAALWCSELGLKAALFEKEGELGGQLLRTFNAIENHLGIEAENGRELRDRFLQHIEKTNVTRIVGAEVVGADLSEKRIDLGDGSRYSAKAIIIATGVRRKTLGVPGEDEFRGLGVLKSGVQSKNDVDGKIVAIVGGGDAALENALILSETAKKVIVIHRRDAFTARESFIARAQERSNIEFLTGRGVTAIIGNTVVEAVELQDVITGARSEIAADLILIRIGVVPNTELFRGQIAFDAAGYISVRSQCETDLVGVYAIGDVASPASPTISTAVGNGASAAKLAAARIATIE